MTKPYESYKDSGIEWLVEIPRHWRFEKLKFLAEVNFSNVDKHIIEGETLVQLCNYVDVYKNDFITPEMTFMRGSASKSEIDKFTLKKDDVLITKDSESSEDIAVPAYVAEDMEGVLCGYHLAQIRPRGIHGNFLFWVLCSKDVNSQYVARAQGITRYGLGKGAIENSRILVPPSSEQQAIADYLDRKTAQIDRLIALKQRQVELLQEQRAALISEAVTRGLDTSVPMKDSGVAWLGKIPSHWEVGKLKFLLRENDGGVWGDDVKDDSGTVVLRSTEITVDGKWQIEEPAMRSLSPSEIKKATLRAGDLLITKSSGSEAHIGKTALVTPEVENLNACYSNFMQRVHPRDGVSSHYLHYFLNSSLAREQYICLSTTTTGLANLNAEIIGDIVITLLPLAEQQGIAGFLDRNTAQIEGLIDRVKLQINLFQEKRTTLISEVVTGKIDVRTAG